MTRFVIEGGPIQPHGHINKRKIKNWNGRSKTKLTGKSLSRRRRSPFNSSAREGGRGEEEEEEKEEEEDLSKWIRANRVMQWCIFNECYTCVFKGRLILIT